MSGAKFQVGEYVQLVNLGSCNSPQYEGTFAKVLANRPATNHDNGYYYDVELHDGQTKGLFERRLQKLPVGTTGCIEDAVNLGYGVRTFGMRYYSLNATDVQPVLTIQTSSTTQEETTMEAQVNTAPETLVGKRVKIRKSSKFYTWQGRTDEGKRRKGKVTKERIGSIWADVKFDCGYHNNYRITDLKIIKDKPKVPKFVPEEVTADTPVGTKVRVKSKSRNVVEGAIGTLARHDSDDYPRVNYSNDFWFVNYTRLETVHPDTAITKDNGDVAL